LRWTFVALLVYPYFVYVAWQKLRCVSFPEAVRDNVVSDDVTITSSRRSVVIILEINFLFS